MTGATKNIIDLFAGPDGWDEGLRLLGRSDVVGIEWDDNALPVLLDAADDRDQLAAHIPALLDERDALAARLAASEGTDDRRLCSDCAKEAGWER